MYRTGSYSNKQQSKMLYTEGFLERHSREDPNAPSA
jgi:hypothetical protein